MLAFTTIVNAYCDALPPGLDGDWTLIAINRVKWNKQNSEIFIKIGWKMGRKGPTLSADKEYTLISGLEVPEFNVNKS